MNVTTRPRAPIEASPNRAARIVSWSAGLAALGALVAMTSSARPTGERIADLAWLSALGVTVMLASRRARRFALLVSTAVVMTAAVGETTTTVVASVALAIAVASAVRADRRPWMSALCGLGIVYAVLHIPAERHPAASAAWFLAAVVPVLLSGYRNAASAHRRTVRWVTTGVGVCGLVLTLAVASTAVRARHLVQDGVSATTSARALVGTDLDGAIDDVGRARRHFASASEAFDTPWLAPTQWFPGAAQHLRVLQVATSQSTLIASRTSAVLETYQNSQTATSESSGFDLPAIAVLSEPVAELHLTLIDATAALDAADSPWLIPQLAAPVSRSATDLATLEQYVEIAVRAVDVAPNLLGQDRPTRWLVAVTNPSESRFQGGFLASYLLLEIDDGEIEVVASGSSGELVDAAGDEQRTLTAPAEFIARYATRYQPTKYFQNLTASPDPVMNAAAVAELFPQTGGGQLDGVVFLDPIAVEALVGLLPRPLTLPDSTKLLDGSNTADHLLREQYLVGDPADVEARRDQLDAIALEAVAQLVRDRPPILELAKLVQRHAQRGNLSLHPIESRAADVFLDAGLAGDRPAPPSTEGADDVMSVRTANAGRNKLDMFLERQVDYETELDGDQVRARLKLRLHNASPPDGLPLYVMGSDGRRSDELGRNTQYVSVYSPFELVTSSVNGVPTTFEFGTEGGLNTYSRLVEIGPMASISIELEFEGQRPFGRSDEPYRLDLWQQPTVNPDLIRTTVGSPESLWRPTTKGSAVVQRDNSLIRSATDASLVTTVLFHPQEDTTPRR